LDVWLQQGLLGLFSFCGLVVVAVVPLVSAIGRNQLIARWQVAAVASLGVLLLHGLVDDSFYGYGGKAIPLMFVPFGVLGQAHSENSKSQPARLLRFFGGAIAVLVIVAIAFPSARAAWFTNLGALSQTRTELSVYRWPQWRIQDELRRSLEADLALVTAQYQSALALDATNAVANRRLGQIELSLGQYDAARQHLLAAYTFAPDQRATRQLLGEAYAITGEIDRAVALWQKIEVGENQLGIRVWWYEHLGERERAALVYQAAQMRGADGF
jgi:tetratricopeptide (TPR) repeat protein